MMAMAARSSMSVNALRQRLVADAVEPGLVFMTGTFGMA